jgi:photosystem II stability/assembly factor-like uncharacterized protein
MPRRPSRLLALWLCLPLLLAVVSLAGAAETLEKPSKGPAEFKGLKFRLVGPAAGGRVARVTGVPGDPLVYYTATASGGVWKSEDGGLHWKPIFDDQPVASIGSIAVAPSNPGVVYVGSGEANIRGNVAAGNGIYKSADGGKTWTHVFVNAGQIGTMIVHPTNPDVAFAAVLGDAFGPNPSRGVFRTQDGGKTWRQVLKKDADTGASDVCFDPSNPNILFAGLWQARRTPWSLTSGGPGSGLYVSRDGGDTWKQLTGHGLPEGVWGKVGVAVARSDGRRVYALIEAEKGGLYRSDDGGDTWELASGHHALTQRAWYYTTMTVDPSNPDVVWFPQVPLLRTVDGGRTIQQVKGPHHGDHHDVWIDPQDPKRMIDGNDGGVDLSWDGGETWTAPLLPIGQFYHVATDMSVPYRVTGAMQDLGTASCPSNSLHSGGIGLADCHSVGGGEAGYTASDPSDPGVVWAGEYFGIITRYDDRTGMARNVSIYPENWSGHGAEADRYRFQWTAPIVISRHDPKTVYHAANVLFKTTDGGQTWTAISPDLTRNDKSKQKWSGGPITGDNTGVEWYDTIFAVAESPREKGLIWAGSDDGLVHLTRDGGAHWTDLTSRIRRIPEWGTVSAIEASAHDAATAYLVVDAHRLDDLHPYLWKTSDYGRSWKSLASKLPQDVCLHAVREDPRRRGLLYLGTERGVMLSRDDGATWQTLGLNLPTVAVHDLVVKDDDLVLGTHGRSIWILDDLTPIRDWSRAIAAEPVHLFPVRPAIRWEARASLQEEGAGENPPEGALINYALKAKPEGDIKMEILDAAGTVVRTLTSVKEEPEYPPDDPDAPETPHEKTVLTTDPGVQRVAWDLAWEGGHKIRGGKGEGNPEAAPRAVPGTYTVRLTVGGTTVTTPVEVRPDPRLQVPAADIAAQVAFSLQVRDAADRLAEMVAQIRSVRDQIRLKTEALQGQEKAAAWVKAAADVTAKLDALEGKLHLPSAQVEYDILAKGARLYSRLGPLLAYATDGTGAPTQGMREVFADQLRELEGYEADWKGLVDGALAALGQQARDLGLGEFVVPQAVKP